MQLVKYDAACRAIAEAKSIDEVRDYRNRAAALRAYARQAKNKQLELDALEIRVRAERRGGEILVELRKQKILRVQGVRDYTTRGQESPLRLSDLGIDSDDSSMFQRLASIEEGCFEKEMAEWRRAAEVARRVEVPLQHVRIPTIKADRQRAAARNGRKKIDAGDIFAKYMSIDGRRLADWRIGELRRLRAIFKRLEQCAGALEKAIPIANPDPIATVQAIFKPSELKAVLDSVWNVEIPYSDGAVNSAVISASRASRTRVCEHCSTQFVMDRRRNTAGRFCSRQCAFAARRTS